MMKASDLARIEAIKLVAKADEMYWLLHSQGSPDCGDVHKDLTRAADSLNTLAQELGKEGR